MITDETYRNRWLNELKKKFILLNALNKIAHAKTYQRIKKITRIAIDRYCDLEFVQFPEDSDTLQGQTRMVQDVVNKSLEICKKNGKFHEPGIKRVHF